MGGKVCFCCGRERPAAILRATMSPHLQSSNVALPLAFRDLSVSMSMICRNLCFSAFVFACRLCFQV